MTTMFKALGKFTRTILVIVGLGGAAMTAVPAQAAPYSSPVEFSLQFGLGSPQYARPRYRICQTDRQVVRTISRYGYHRVRLQNERGNFVRATARKGRSTYSIRYNRCSARIVSADRVRRQTCQTARQVVRTLSRSGYDRVRIRNERGNFVRATATRGRWVYSIQYNRCTHRIVNADRVRRAR